MNIFVLDEFPQWAARYHNNKHVPKMLEESAKMLCMAHHMHCSSFEGILPPTHEGHPCVKWVASCSGNYVWTLELMKYLGDEYSSRRLGQHVYTHSLWNKLASLPKKMTAAPREPFVRLVGHRYEGASHVVEAYRDMYFGEKQHMAEWSPPAGVPAWWTQRLLTSQRRVS